MYIICGVLDLCETAVSSDTICTALWCLGRLVSVCSHGNCNRLQKGATARTIHWNWCVGVMNVRCACEG